MSSIQKLSPGNSILLVECAKTFPICQTFSGDIILPAICAETVHNFRPDFHCSSITGKNLSSSNKVLQLSKNSLSTIVAKPLQLLKGFFNFPGVVYQSKSKVFFDIEKVFLQKRFYHEELLLFLRVPPNFF